MTDAVMYIFLGVCICYVLLIAFAIWTDYERLQLEKRKDKDANGKVGRGKDGKFTSLK
jgi:hypothetical protein